MTRSIGLLLVLFSGIFLAACDAEKQPMTKSAQETTEADIAWAVNIGGAGLAARDGTVFESESSVSGGKKGVLDRVKGSQDPLLYQSYREGDVKIERALENGLYDVTFFFAEPNDVNAGDRVFSSLINGQTVIEDLDVMSSRDGKVKSALTVTIPNVEVADEQLQIDFSASVGQPVISALLVRRKNAAQTQWRLLWEDDFAKPALNEKLWSINEWPARKVNDEDQAYTAREKNIRIEEGMLILEAHKEAYDDAAYTSGRIHSSGKADLLYGRIEVRARLPRGMGTWPAIWMLPSDPFRYATTCEAGEEWQGSSTCDAWPNSGEIDIMEHVGYEMGHVHGTVHNQAYYWLKWEQRKGRVILDDVDQAFHVYSMEWTPERIDIFVDDVHYFTYVNEHTGWESWPYDHPFHLVLNVAVGGMWGRSGGGIDDSVFPQRMEVDFVRFYEAL